MFSSDSAEWETPEWLFKYLDNIYNFELDVCANEKNTKCKNFYTIKDNCLEKKWVGNCFMNPPYGRKIIDFVRKAYIESWSNNVVCLLPARTDTKWFHEYCIKAESIWFLKGRLKFSNCKNSAPFPSCIIKFSPERKLLKTEYLDVKDLTK